MAVGDRDCRLRKSSYPTLGPKPKDANLKKTTKKAKKIDLSGAVLKPTNFQKYTFPNGSKKKNVKWLKEVKQSKVVYKKEIIPLLSDEGIKIFEKMIERE